MQINSDYWDFNTKYDEVYWYFYQINFLFSLVTVVYIASFLRSKQIESACFSGTAAFMEVRIQSVVVEFILNHVDVLFSTKLSSLIREGGGTYRLSEIRLLLLFLLCYLLLLLLRQNQCFTFPGHNSLSRPKSLLISSPSTKLLSLEEAQARTQAQINSPVTEDSKYIEVGEGPAALQGKFHTVIEFPTERFVNSSSHPDRYMKLNQDAQD